MKEQKEKLQELIESREPDIKKLWKAGKLSESVCLETNIDKARHFLKLNDSKMIKKMTFVLTE